MGDSQLITLGNLRVAVVGLGLMGGSLALGLRPSVAAISAVDPNEESLAAALAAGVIDRGTADLAAGIAGVDLIVLATPVRTILDMLAKLPALCPAGCLVMDLGSTKGEVCEAMEGLPSSFQAIGGHPMCGKESSGFGEADEDLFDERTFILCRTEQTTPLIERLALAVVGAVGGRPLFLPPSLHDELVSVTSHLPYLVSSMLMWQAAGAAEAQENLWSVSASGFRDASRLSGSSPAVMGDILLTNRTAVLAQLQRYQEILAGLTDILETEDDQALLDWLEGVRKEYGRYRGIMNNG